MSNDWLQKWKCFVTNHLSSKLSPRFKKSVKSSMNPRIGILPPGRIENGILINSNEPVESDSYIKNGLVVDKDYRILSKNVWEKLIQIY